MSRPGFPESVLVAPDSFKGTHSSLAVAEWIAAGLRSAGRPAEVCPVADGGEGTAEVLRAAHGGEWLTVPCRDPLGRTISAGVALLPDGTAVLDTAAASGLTLLSTDERDAEAATTYGTGELIAAAVQAGAKTVLLGVGGSATTDGGTGATQAIREAGGLHGAKLVLLCDVRTAFEDAARVFAPQKGADQDQVRRLSERLRDLAGQMSRDPRGVPFTGAAGGLAGGLWAAYGAELVPGASWILDRLDFDRRMRASRAVITGEGCLDHSSLAGKAVSEVATQARQAGVPCHAVVGRRTLDAFGARVLDLEAVLEASTPAELRAAGETLAALL